MIRLDDVQVDIFETQGTDGCFSQEQTVAKNSGMTEMRDNVAEREVEEYERAIEEKKAVLKRECAD